MTSIYSVFRFNLGWFLCNCCSLYHFPSYFYPYQFLEEVTTKKLQLKRKSVTQKIELEEAKPEEPEQKVTFKITKKKKSVAEMELKTEPEKEPEAFKVQLKKRKKKKVHQAQEVEERIPVEETTEFSGTPTEVIEFIDIEDGLPSTEITTEGVIYVWMRLCITCDRMPELIYSRKG